MNTQKRVSVLVALVGACVLLVGGFGLALDGAGPYRNLLAVRVGIFVGVVPAYFAALWVSSWICTRVKDTSGDSRRHAILLLLSVAAGVATLLAPLIPSAALAVICLSEALCPPAANPILWSLLKLVTDLPMLPILVGISVVFSTVFWSSRHGGANAG
jgi:hypothetical protein